MSRAGPFEALHHACFPLAPAQPQRTLVHRRVCVRERVWAPVMVVIVVNLTTVKAVTACPYKPVYATESGAPGAVQNLALVEIAKQPAFPCQPLYS